MSEIEIIKLFIDEREEKGFGPETTVREIVVLLLESEDGHLFLDDSEEPLDHDKTLKELGIKGHSHIHASHCKRVEVGVEYAGKGPVEKTFPPTAKIKAVKDWAVALPEFGIEAVERPKFGLFIPGDKNPLSEAARIGSLAHKGECKVILELALRERWQG